MELEQFDYHLPKRLIAQTPLEKRDKSRVMVVDRRKRSIDVIEPFSEIASALRPGDLLVVNNSRVIPARLFGRRKQTGGKVELLLIREEEPGTWKALVKPAKRIRTGEQVVFGDGILEARVVEEGRAGERTLAFCHESAWSDVLDALGQVPLPPYIKTPLANSERYQTVYAQWPGSVAAPTAGLHFTRPLLDTLRKAGIEIAEITLHVGTATFRPVFQDDCNGEHTGPGSEYCEISASVAAAMRAARARGGKVIAVGTTAVRTLEARARDDGTVAAGAEWTSLFIYPPYRFKVVDRMITNFHLPMTSLLMLVCAFADRDTIMKAYREAVRREFRFYSFGDAMFIL